ncbi:hypothetical protein PSTG_02214 [Puccinia striiformis f. sp. tritici PST-78]|uniref:Alpha-galactosidase n=1 Tax=Puccinia striiformis f. sp. tritici PST-78 TaxID=1165861 RepID=A0A0L0VZT9_9BASI|nr:hypothetical protein PSTG_02214 [Puccinia striiformis f. sp. tritici PST-78]
MVTTTTPKPVACTLLLLHICLFFVASHSLAKDNMTVFSTSSSEDHSYHQNSSSSSTTKTYGGAFDNTGRPSTTQGAKNWCGKPLGGSFKPNSDVGASNPALLSRPLLNLQCTPKLNPYTEADDPQISSLIVDAGLTYYPMEGAVEISEKVQQLQVVIINTNTSQAVTAGIVGVNTFGNQFQFPLTTLGNASTDSYQIICQAYSHDEFIAESSLSLKYLPDLSQKGMGEAVRINSESGTLMVTNDKGSLQTLIPFGFAVDYSKSYSPTEMTELINSLQELNVNTVQLILARQGANDISQLREFIRALGKAGIWIQYDLRNVYWNKELVASHIEVARRHPNVLLYHTAMEPDGLGTEVRGIHETSESVKQHDPYHPVSLTLTCEDYQFANYTSGNDIILTNPFVIGVDKRSPGDVTPSNSTYGSSTCDNCRGSFLDLVNRIRIFRNRRHALRKDRTMQIWGVPQANSVQNGVNQVPTGEQFLLMCTTYLIEGAVGLMTWNDKMNFSPDLKKAIQTIGASLPQIGRYLEIPQSFLPLPPVTSYPNDTFIANIWLNQADQTILVMVANLAPKQVSWEVNPPAFNFNSTTQLQTSWLYVSEKSQHPQIGQKEDHLSLKGRMNGYGFGAWIIQAKSTLDNTIEAVSPLNTWNTQ